MRESGIRAVIPIQLMQSYFGHRCKMHMRTKCKSEKCQEIVERKCLTLVLAIFCTNAVLGEVSADFPVL